MIKIKNPYSKKRFTIKEKAQKRFTRAVIPYIKKLPHNEDWNVKPKFIPEALIRIIQNLEYRRKLLYTNNIPEDVQVNILSIYVAEYIPIEDVDKLNKGLKKVFKEFKPKFDTNDLSNIDKFCNEVKQSIHGRSWSNFGYIEIDKNNELSNFVKLIRVSGTQVSSSSVVIQFIINPSDNFQKEYKQLIENNVKEEPILTPKLKNFFRFWGSHTVSNIIVKEQMIEDLLLELKWRTLKEIGKYFDTYFYKNKLNPPSIEIYKIKQKSCNYNDESEERNQFWDSIGMRDSHFYEISRDGYWQLFASNKNHLIDNSIKLSINEEMRQRDMFNSLDLQMVYVDELAMNILPILVMKNYTNALSRKIAGQQKRTFKSLNKERPKYNKLIKIRYELEQNLQILKRFKNEISDDEFDWLRSNILSLLSDFEPARPMSTYTSWGESIIDNTLHLIEKTYTLSQNFAKIIDDTARLIEIKINNSLRKRTFWLTIFTVVLSVLATAIATTSFYFDLSEESKQEIRDFIYHYFK